MSPANSLEGRCSEILRELGLLALGDKITCTPLSGGVASDIARVSTQDTTYCIKFARGKLKVLADWYAPVHRSAAEYAWLQVASTVDSGSAVRLYGQSKTMNGFVMEFVGCDGGDVSLWKRELLAETTAPADASRVGDLLGRLHSASSATDFDRRAFCNADDFHALRIEPYLLYTAQRYPELATNLHALAESLYNADTVLIHGDVSPKNILFRDAFPVLLDAECATMGDASFDVAFCLNHLILKAIHLPNSRALYLAKAASLWHAYQLQVCWEPIDALEERVCHLLPALMLARVDGKSPVEYLSPESSREVRAIASQAVLAPPGSVRAFVNHLK